MDPKSKALMHKMLDALRSEQPLEPLEVANASLGIMCLALSKMRDAKQRDHLLTNLDAAARESVSRLMRGEETTGAPTWLQ